MKSHWTIAIYGTVLVLNALLIWACPRTNAFVYSCWIAIVAMCVMRIILEFCDWES